MSPLVVYAFPQNGSNGSWLWILSGALVTMGLGLALYFWLGPPANAPKRRFSPQGVRGLGVSLVVVGLALMTVAHDMRQEFQKLTEAISRGEERSLEGVVTRMRTKDLGGKKRSVEMEVSETLFRWDPRKTGSAYHDNPEVDPSLEGKHVRLRYIHAPPDALITRVEILQ
jgi:hypothetical protein